MSNATGIQPAALDNAEAAESDAARMLLAAEKLSRLQPAGEAGRNKLFDIPVVMKVVIGSASIPISELIQMQSGKLIVLDRDIGQPVELVVNGAVVARGQIVVCDGETPKLGISITQTHGEDK